jgi:hypothetical protein
MVPSEEEFQAARNDAFRAIGRYVAVFSELIRGMREQVALHAAKDAVASWRALTIEIALGEMQALPMSHAFFGLAIEAAKFEPDDPGKKIASLLAEETEKTIRTRNDIAHGDWHVGYVAFRDGDRGDITTLPRWLIRVLAHDKEGPFKRLNYSVEKLDQLTDDMLRLLGTIDEFGKLAFGFALTRAESGVTRGDYKVADIYAVRGTGSSKKVVRDGPKSGEVFFHPYV